MRYRFIQESRTSFTVVKMRRILNVSSSGFYRWQRVPFSKRKEETRQIGKRIAELYREHKGMAGIPLIAADLCSEADFSTISKNRVARHMKETGLRCRTLKEFVVTTDSRHAEPVSPNLLNRECSVDSANKVWVSDITHLKVGQKWHYLTVFIDFCS